MSRTLVLGLCVLLTLMAASVARADAAVFPVTGANLEAGERDAIGRLIASAYAYRTGRPVVPPNRAAEALAQEGSPRDALQRLGVDEYVQVEAIALDTRISLSVSLHNKYGSQLFALRTTASSLDDMEIVSERIAEALARRTGLAHTRTIDSVTGREMQAKNRMFIEKIVGVRTGGSMLLGKNIDGSAAVSLMFDARMEGTAYFLEVGAGFMVSSFRSDAPQVVGLIGQLGGSYYLSKSSVSPYVGFGVSPRLMTSAYQGGGFSLNGHLGLMFMREYSTRFYAELRVDQNLVALSVKQDAPQALRLQDQSVLPTELCLAVGIGW